MKAMFICDNEEEWTPVKNFFSEHFSKINLVCAHKNMETVQLVSEDRSFLFVLIQANLKNFSAQELYTQLDFMGKKKPVIFIGEKDHKQVQEESIDLKEAQGNFAVVYKPFEVAQFKAAIMDIFKYLKEEQSKPKVIEVNRDDYVPMKIRNFYRFDKIPYDAYIELSRSKFIKVINKNESYPPSLVQKYITKDVKFFFLYKEDYLELLEKTAAFYLKIFYTKKLAPKSQISLQIKSSAVIQEYVRNIGVSETMIRLNKLLINSILGLFNTFQNYSDFLKTFPFEHNDVAEQSILTAYTCESLAKNIGWNAELSRKKLILASILHDCMLSSEDLIKITSLEDPNLMMFTPEEQEEYRQHPSLAAELVHHFPGFPDTDFIISQHHELPSGRGFPSGLNSNQLTLLSCIFIVANNFVGEISQKGIAKQNILRILSNFKSNYNEGNFKKPMKGLMDFFKAS